MAEASPAMTISAATPITCKRRSHSFAEFSGNAIPCLDLQRQNFFELVKQRLGLRCFETAAFESGYQRELGVRTLLTLCDMLFCKLEMFPRDGSIDEGRHDTKTSNVG
jgi:hypothetical protein